MKLYFVAFEGTSITSKIIKFSTRSRYSHIAYMPIYTPGGPERELIEAWHIEGKLRWGFSSFANHTPGTYFEIWALDVSESIFNMVDNDLKIMARNKTGYDHTGVLGFELKFIKDNPNTYFCSEGCIKELVRQKRWNKIRPEYVSPIGFVWLIQVAGSYIVEAGRT